MVAGELFEGMETYVCGVCGFHYETEETAGACEASCKNGLCSSDITANALERR